MAIAGCDGIWSWTAANPVGRCSSIMQCINWRSEARWGCFIWQFEWRKLHGFEGTDFEGTSVVGHLWCDAEHHLNPGLYNGDFFLICFFFGFCFPATLLFPASLLLCLFTSLLVRFSASLLLCFSLFYESQPDKLASFFFCERSERLGVWGRCFRTGPFFHTQLVFRVSPGSVLQDNVPARTWVTVGCRFSPSSLILGLNR